MKIRKAINQIRHIKNKNNLPMSAIDTAVKSLDLFERLQHEIDYRQDLYSPPEDKYEQGVYDTFGAVAHLLNEYKREIEDN